MPLGAMWVISMSEKAWELCNTEKQELLLTVSTFLF